MKKILLSIAVLFFSFLIKMNSVHAENKNEIYCMYMDTYYPFSTTKYDECDKLNSKMEISKSKHDELKKIFNVYVPLFSKLEFNDNEKRDYLLKKRYSEAKSLYEMGDIQLQEITKKQEQEERLKLANLETIKKNKQEQEERLKLANLEKNYGKKCEEGFFQKGFKKGTNEFNNCLVEKEKIEQFKIAENKKRIEANLQKAQEKQVEKEKIEQAKIAENKKRIEANSQKIQKNQDSNKTTANLTNIEKICLDFGYRKGTEKFADCLKDLYLQEKRAGTESIINKKNNSNNEAILEMERARTQALQDAAQAQQDAARAQQEQADAIRNRNQTDALMNLSRSLLQNNNPKPGLNCQSYKVGFTTQTRCQ